MPPPTITPEAEASIAKSVNSKDDLGGWVDEDGNEESFYDILSLAKYSTWRVP